MSAPILEAHRLSRNFGPNPILREVSIELAAGRGAAIIGANGSGKSTLVRIFAGLLAPSAGSVLVFGRESRRLGPAERHRIGLLTHQSFLYPNLTARENLIFYASLYGIAPTREATARALARVGLEAAADQRVRTLSRGMEQRLAIARATLAGPALLLLDEPFAALDSAGVEVVGELVRESLDRGAAVVVTAHNGVGLAGADFERYELVRGRLHRTKGLDRAGECLRSLIGR